MEIPESLVFEMLGRTVLLSEVQKRQIDSLVGRVRRAEEAAAQAVASQQEALGHMREHGLVGESSAELPSSDSSGEG